MNSVAIFALLGSAIAAEETNFTCPNITVMHSVSGDGWYDACLGLNVVPEAEGDVAKCKDACYTDMSCTIWQFIQDGDVQKCWTGSVVHGCLSRHSSDFEKFEGDLIDGEQVQHGFIKVVSTNSKVETIGLKNYPEKSGTDDEKMTRCKEACYSDITCTVWEYATTTGCWMSHTGFQPTGETKTDSEFALAMLGGETIEHTCPPYVPPEEGLPWPWIITGIVLGLLACGAIAYFMTKKPKVKKTRAVKVEPKPQPVQMVQYFVPQPTVLIPQTSMVQVPQYQYQQVAAPTTTYAAPTTTYAAPTATYAAPTTYATTPPTPAITTPLMTPIA